MASSLLKSPRRTRRRTNNVANNPQPTTPIEVTAAAKAGSVLTLTFDQPVSLNGVPAYTTDLDGVTATSATLTSATTVAVTFSAAITTATEVLIPYEEPAIRNASGGFVSTSTFPVT